MNSHSRIALGVKRALATAVLTAVTALPLAYAETRYGPVRPGETLSDIVNGHYLISPFSDQTLMQAIVSKNPNAFINKEPGRLRQGVTLTLPDDAAIRQLQGSIDINAVSRLVAAQSAAPAPAPAPASRAVVSNSTPAPVNNSELSSLQQDLSEARRERDRLRDELRILEQNDSGLKNKLIELETENQQRSRDLASAQNSLKTLREQLSQAEVKTAEALEVAAKAQADAADAKLEASSVAAQAAKQTVSAIVPSEDTPDQPATVTPASTESVSSDTLADAERRINELEGTIKTLQTQKERELADLRDAIAEKDTIVQAMQGNMDDLDETVRRYEAEIFELTSKNTALSDQLEVKPASAESPVPAAANPITPATQSISQPTAAFDPFSVRSVEDLKRPVNVPLWGLLLGGLALALTSLLMLFGRRKRNDEIVPVAIAPTIEAEVEPELIFRTGSSQLQDPDVESLRVPPRRDPSRVAVLDPSIQRSSAAAAVTNDSIDPDLSPEQIQESKLKLAMAEAYLELNDDHAATVLLQEVRQEGSAEHIATANKLLSRMP